MDSYVLRLLILNVSMGLILASLGAIVYLNNPTKLVNRLYFVNTLTVAIWFIVRYLSSISESMSTIWIDRLAVGLSPLMGLTIYYFARSFVRAPVFRRAFSDWLVCIPPVVTLFLSQTALFVERTETLPHHEFYIAIGPMYPLNTLYIGITVVCSIYLLVKKAMSTRSRDFNKKLLLVIFGIGSALVINLFVDVYLIIIKGNTTSQHHTVVSYLGFLIYALCVLYAMVRHGLFEIRRAIARASTYFMLLVSLTIIYGLVMVLLADKLLDSNIGRGEIIVLAGIIALVAFSQPFLKQLFNRMTHKLFYRYIYSTDKVLDELSSILIREFDLQQILQNSIVLLQRTLLPSSATIVVLDSAGKLVMVQGSAEGGNLPEISQDTVSTLSRSKRSYTTIDSASGNIKRYLKANNAYAVIKLQTQNGLVALMILGRRLNGGDYNHQDSLLLTTFANNLSLAIENARNYQEVSTFADKLQIEVTRATQKLSESNAKLQRLSKTKDEFISMASHQLLPQLTSIGGLSEVLKSSPQQSSEILPMIKQSSSRMASLVTDMLSVSKIQHGKLILNLEPTNLVQLVQEEISNLQYLQEKQKVRVTYHHPKHVVVLIDPGKYREVVYNLIENAIVYSNANSEIRVTVSRKGGKTSLTISDRGIGIPEVDQKHLFTNYFRASNAVAKRPNGTGIGLFVAREVVEAHKHELIFVSEENKGSIFGFAMPN